MTRYIDADALIIGVTNVMPCNGLNVDCGFCQFYDKEERFCLLEDWIYSAPTIDAVEVVRCENCKYGSEDYPKDIFPDVTEETYSCDRSTYCHDKDFYCKYGERKTE